MSKNLNVLLLCGGGSTEHEISLISAKYLLEKCQAIEGITPYYVEIKKDGTRVTLDGKTCELRKAGELIIHGKDESIYLNFAIPCIHGPPGESGDIQGLFEMMELPYFGAGPEASKLCFNKVSTKLWLDALGIPNTPFLFTSQFNGEEIQKAKDFFKQNSADIFIKASNQGSSVGCYHVTEENQLEEKLKEALNLSPFALLEKTVKGRELEVATYEYKNQVMATLPGEISCPNGFYTYEEKYAGDSHTETHIEAKNLSDEIKGQLKQYALKAFTGLKIKHLSRIDFFLEGKTVYLNEINTFPGHTPTSMFPTMLENTGLKYEDYLENIIKSEARP